MTEGARGEEPTSVAAALKELRKNGLTRVTPLPELLRDLVPPAHRLTEGAVRAYLTACAYEVRDELESRILRMALAVGEEPWADPGRSQDARRSIFARQHPGLGKDNLRVRRELRAFTGYLALLDRKLSAATTSLADAPVLRIVEFDHTFRLRETAEVDESWIFVALLPVSHVTRMVQWGASLREYDVEVLEGGRRGQVVEARDGSITFAIELPRTLEPGERGYLRVRQTFPARTLLFPSTHFAAAYPPERLGIHLHVFDDPAGYEVWRRSGAPEPDMPIGVEPYDDRLELDRFGCLDQYFTDMLPNHYYGVSWRPR